MDVFSFINSKDVATYLGEIGYQFTLPEAAFLVDQSHRASLDDKLNAWRTLMANMPDCSMDERPNMKRIASFKKFLEDYCELQECRLDRFVKADGCL